MKIIVKCISTLVTIVTALVILLALPMTVPKLFHINPYMVLSGSMEPAIHTGAIAFVDGNDTDVEPGDIVTYKMKDTAGEDLLVTHRIVRIEGGRITTKGDANDNEDFVQITQDDIVGTYLFSVPYAGYIADMVMKPKVMMVIVLWLILLNVISIVLNNVVSDDDEDEEGGVDTAQERPVQETNGEDTVRGME